MAHQEGKPLGIDETIKRAEGAVAVLEHTAHNLTEQKVNGFRVEMLNQLNNLYAAAAKTVTNDEVQKFCDAVQRVDSTRCISVDFVRIENAFAALCYVKNNRTATEIGHAERFLRLALHPLFEMMRNEGLDDNVRLQINDLIDQCIVAVSPETAQELYRRVREAEPVVTL